MAAKLSPAAFADRLRGVRTLAEQQGLLQEALDQENEYRCLFSSHRASWEVPEVTDPVLGLVDVYANADLFRALPRFEEDARPRCFELGEKRLAQGTLTVTESMREFETSWDCFTESQLRFLDWSNVFAAGGSIGACLAPLPKEVQDSDFAQSRKKRRKFFHDEGFPGSDVDLFLYGLTQEQAEHKLNQIFQAVQAANPFEVICFRSAHAVTMVSQYPFRHIQVVLRLYNSPAEVLMGFDVDACACGFDGKRVLVCPRAAMAFATQGNSVDMTRRSPSYEMRLAKYAQRGFEVVVPDLDRSRVDPFIYEKRFDQVQGLARLLLLERLRTPEARFQYRQEQRLQTAAGHAKYQIQRELRKVLHDKHTLSRMEGSIVATAEGAELSNYSTVFLPWGPAWQASKVRRVMAKKDRVLNSVEFLPGGRTRKNTRKYRIHVCFIGTMTEVLSDCFPDDPPIPSDVDPSSLQQFVRGPVSWLVDNPGRQQIGSFHPITSGDWTEGAFLSAEMEELTAKCVADDAQGVTEVLSRSPSQLEARDFLGRSALHVAALAHSPNACRALLGHPAAGPAVLQARLANGRSAIHLAALHGFHSIVELFCTKRRELAAAAASDEEGESSTTAKDVLDIDAADWELKLSPMQYAVVLGHTKVVEMLLAQGADVKKMAVHKDKSLALTTLSLCKSFARGSRDLVRARELLKVLLAAGASSGQVDLVRRSIWHDLVPDPKDVDILELFLQEDPNRAVTISGLNQQGHSPLYAATISGNADAVKLLLKYGAAASTSEEDFAAQRKGAAGAGPGPGRGFRSQAGGEDSLRSPILPAVLQQDVRCLRAFLDHDPELVHTASQEAGQHKRSLLDLAEALVKSAKEQQESQTKNGKPQQKRLEVAQQGLSQHAAGSYGHNWWGLILHREEQALKDSAANPFMKPDDDGEEQQDPVKKAEELVKVLRDFGGKPFPQEEGADDEGAQVPGRGFGHSFFNRKGQGGKLEPELDHAAYDPPPGGMFYHVVCERLPKGDQPTALALCEAAWAGDATAVAGFASKLRVTMVNPIGQSPLFIAVLRGHTACARALLEVARRQFQEPVRQKDDEGAGDVASQLKRVNNLELASGSGVPAVGSGRTAEAVRAELQALELGAAGAGGSAGSAAAGEASIVRTKTPPEAMLSFTSPVSVGEVPALKELLERLAAAGRSRRKGGGGDDEGEAKVGQDDEEDEQLEDEARTEEPSKVVSLTPLQLAVVCGDLPTVQLLLEFLLGGQPKAGGDGDEDGTAQEKEEEEEQEEEEDEEDDEDGEESDKQTGGGESQGRTDKESRKMALATGAADLHGLNLLEIAAVADRPEIFLAVAAHAKELALPSAALAAWRREVADSLKESGEEKAANSGFGLYGGGGGQTLLQTSLYFGADKVAEVLVGGGANSALLGWLGPAAEARKKSAASASGRKQTSSSEGLSRWLLDHLSSNPSAIDELASRLLWGAAVDSQGRNAAFYAPGSSLPRLVASGPQAYGDLEQRMNGGATPLLAAVYAGEEEQVRALLSARCDVTAVRGKGGWNALHYAVLSAEVRQTKGRWHRAHQLALTVLSAASPAEAEELLAAPKAEHTPLMLAVEKGADEALLGFLVQRGGTRTLARRDARLRTALHVAAATCRPRAVQALLAAATADTSKTDGKEEGMASTSTTMVSAAAEDAKGVTPFEGAAEQVAQVWDQQQPNHPNRLFNFNQARAARKKSKKAKDPEPPKADPVHQCYSLLDKAVDRSQPHHRATVSFTEVQIAAKSAAERAAKAETVQRGFGHHPGSGDDAPQFAHQLPWSSGGFGMFSRGMRWVNIR